MTTTTTSAPTTAVVAERRPVARIWRTGAAFGVGAAAASTAVAALGHAAGASLELTGAPGEPIPYLGFAQMTLIGTLVGLVIATVLARRASAPARTFTVTAVALTVASCLPSLAMGADGATKLTLVLTHVVAAAIVVPAIARALAR